MNVTNQAKKRLKTAIIITLNAIGWVALAALIYFIMFTGSAVHSTTVGKAGPYVGFFLLVAAFCVLVCCNKKNSTFGIVNSVVALALSLVLIHTSVQYLTTTTCPNCGKWESTEYSYCEDCGTQLPHIKHICPVCNEDRDTDFCDICGSEIVEVN